MRILIAIVAAVAVLLTGIAASDAKSNAKNKRKAVHKERLSAKAQRFDPNDPKCIEAEYLDPSGNYAAYPCWARAALAPKGNDGGWR
ncbi:hypothetical protein ACO2I3_20105 [Leptospira interrogans]